MPSRRIASVDGRLERLEKHPLAVELVIGVLCQQPCVLGALLTDEHSPRPSELGNDRSQTIRVRDAHALQLDSLLKRHPMCKHTRLPRGPHALIDIDHRRQLGHQAIVHGADATSGDTTGQWSTAIRSVHRTRRNLAGVCFVKDSVGGHAALWRERCIEADGALSTWRERHSRPPRRRGRGSVWRGRAYGILQIPDSGQRLPLKGDQVSGVARTLVAVDVMLAMEPAEVAQVGSAVFAAIAAFAALATVMRAEHDRRDRALPDLHVEVVQDLGAAQVRAYVVNYGGPAREVRVFGVLGRVGFGGDIGPTSYWRPGESRTVVLGAPPDTGVALAYVFVEGRDVRKRYLFVATVGGATYRWPLRKAKKISSEDIFRRLFPEVGTPLHASNLVPYEVTERAW